MRSTKKLLSQLTESRDNLLKRVHDLEQIIEELERIGRSKSDIDEGSAIVGTSEISPDVSSAPQEPKVENLEGDRELGNLNPEQDKQ